MSEGNSELTWKEIMAAMMEKRVLPDNIRVGFIGAGNMASALISAFIQKDLVSVHNITASAQHEDTLLRLKNKHDTMFTTLDNVEVVRRSDVVFLAVKPHIVPDALREVYGAITPDKLVISIAAGLTLDTLQNQMPPGSRVIRVMPNTGSQVAEGAAAYCCGKHTLPEDGATVDALMSCVGLCEEMPEKYIDIICGVAGSGIAFMYMGIEALADGAVRMGLPRKTALKFAAQTMLGAAKMVKETGKHPGVLKDEVCSPGGTTIAGVHELERGAYRANLMNAVEAAVKRGREMGKQ